MDKSRNPNGKLYASDGNASVGAMCTASRKIITSITCIENRRPGRDFGIPRIGELKNSVEARKRENEKILVNGDSCGRFYSRLDMKDYEIRRVHFISDVSVLVTRGHVHIFF